MNFSISGVIAPDIRPRYYKLHIEALGLLGNSFGSGELADVDLEISYCPIILTPENKSLYPSKTYFDRNSRVLFCALYLDYKTCLDGNFEQMRAAFYTGLLDIIPFLEAFGLRKALVERIANSIKHAASL